MRIISLDYGSRTVGVAVTDGLGMTVSCVETIVRKEENKLRRTCARIEELVKEYGAEMIVVGNPLNMDGTEGERSQLAREFAQMIKRRTGLETAFVDERLTTVEAEEILRENGTPAEDMKKKVDQVAAVLILEDYLSRQEETEYV